MTWGEGRCLKIPEDAYEFPRHCVHLRVKTGDYICCWCGDLFIGDDPAKGDHGQYQPRRERRKKT